MAADKIYANPNTTTGSIGVIMSGFDMTGLYEKLGIRYVSITSGDFKDSSKMTDEQIAVYQEQVDEYYNKFVGIVAEGRGMAEEDVKTLADGRVSFQCHLQTDCAVPPHGHQAFQCQCQVLASERVKRT